MNNDLDEWYVKEVRPFRDNEPLVCQILLEQYNTNSPISKSTTFHWFALGGCIDSAAAIANQILSDSSSTYSYRCDALLLLIILQEYSANVEVDVVALHSLLLEMPVGTSSVWQAIKLVKNLMNNDR